MYNFLDSKLSPKVATVTVCADNYEVENLISDDNAARTRGFMAYMVVKPPVEVTFELICPINTHYIILSTDRNPDKYTSIEILAKHSNRDFASIAYARFNNAGVVFYNDRIYSSSNPPPNIDRSYYLSFFKRNAFRSFTTANVIKVRITRTDGTVPCLGKVEIWGKPSKTCSLTTVNTIDRLMQRPVNATNQATSNSVEKNIISVTDDWEIPEEFKDALTFEIMSLPVTLPSGNTVDQTTLEKCMESEAAYGRAPSDPFTGQKLTDSRKPVFNASLKYRIDLFLLQNSHRNETFTLKRTLGTSGNVSSSNNTNTVKRKIDGEVFKETKVAKTSDHRQELVVNAHSASADDRLNEAIQKVVTSRGFVRFTDEEDVCTPELPSCVKCKIGTNLYSLPCSHLYCRSCLLSVCSELKCIVCAGVFCKSDPKKVSFITETRYFLAIDL